MQPKDPPRLNSIGRIVTPVYEPESDMNYSLSAQEDKCLFWNSTVEQWSTQGCRVSAYCRVTPEEHFLRVCTIGFILADVGAPQGRSRDGAVVRVLESLTNVDRVRFPI